MAADVAVRVEGLSKLYRIGQERQRYDTLRDQVQRSARQLVTRSGKHDKGRDLWAVRDVSFDVARGEVLGIVGRNGAGKTTMLRILSRITEPTEGRAEIHGRLGSLLEVGTGFHPELTGRDNVFLNGAILGMRRAEIARKFDEIVEFSGVQKFIDTPVKRYSSGMYVRLAFSVAAHLEPEILVVDEVLAVGDAEFQRRCMGKMESIGQAGRTVLFVSHNMQAITRMCDRVLLLDGGRLIKDGPAPSVVSAYLQGQSGSSAHRDWPDANDAPGDDQVRLRSVRVVDEAGDIVDSLDVRREVGIEMTFDVLRDGPPFHPQIMVVNEQGIHAFNAMDTSSRWHGPTPPGTYSTTARIPGNLLNEGLMTVSVFLSSTSSGKTAQHVFERDVVAFQVIDPVEGDSAKGRWTGNWGGAVRPLLTWDTAPR